MKHRLKSVTNTSSSVCRVSHVYFLCVITDQCQQVLRAEPNGSYPVLLLTSTTANIFCNIVAVLMNRLDTRVQSCCKIVHGVVEFLIVQTFKAILEMEEAGFLDTVYDVSQDFVDIVLLKFECLLLFITLSDNIVYWNGSNSSQLLFICVS